MRDPNDVPQSEGPPGVPPIDRRVHLYRWQVVGLGLLLLIPEIVSKALTGEDHSLTAALIGVATLLVLVFLISVLAFRFPAIGRITEGQPAVLARDGELLAEAMNRERISPEEIRGELHKNGLEELSQIRWAMLEVDGSITLVPTRREDAKIQRNRKELP